MNVVVTPPAPSHDAAHKFFNRVAREAGTRILESTVPIYHVSNDSIAFDRSGLLFRIGAESFVLTAAHHIRGYIERAEPLCVDVSQKTEMPIPLIASKFYYTEANDQTSDRDIAAIHLDREAVEEFYPQRRFLTLADCDLLIDPKPGLYMVAGFPEALYEMIPIARGTAMFFMGAVEPSPPSVVFDPSVHLSLSLEGPGRRATDTEFVDEAIPAFPGMSGCGIWRIASGTMSDPDSWNPSMVRLVAIQNRTGHGSHTIGTWIKHVVDRIIADCPNLKAATDIIYPTGY